MIGNDRVVAIVPARAGSKGIPGKNLRPVGGTPLLSLAIQVAQEVGEIDRVVVSTDGDDLAEVARSHGCEVMDRPDHLATDTATMMDVLRDIIERLREEGESARYLVLLEPTSPLRTADDIRRCLTMVEERRLDSVATFTEAEHHPHRAWEIVDSQPSLFIPGAVPWLPRQQLPTVYRLNGVVYVFDIDALPDDAGGPVFGSAGAVVMDRERSIDIDHEIDLMVADALIRRPELS